MADSEPLTFEAEREQLRRRRIFVGLPLLLTLVAGIGVSTHPLLHAIKAWQARRLSAESLALSDQGELMEAADKARDAYQIYRLEPEVWRAWGRVLTRSGQGRTATLWWRKIAAEHRLAVEDRRDWIVAALASDADSEAKPQVDWLLAQKAGPTPVDLLLAAQEAAWRHDDRGAEAYNLRVLANPSAGGQERLRGAGQILVLEAPAASSVTTATTQLARLAREKSTPLALNALTLLAGFALQVPPSPVTGAVNESISPGEIADDLEKSPYAGDYDRLLALELHSQADPARAQECLAEAVRRYGSDADDNVLNALAGWLYRAARYETILEILPMQRAKKDPRLATQYLDALVVRGRWQEARLALEDPSLPLDPMYTRMYLASVRAHLGEGEGAARKWESALEAAGKDAARLIALGDYARKAGVGPTADAAYAAASVAAPDLRAPYILRFQLALSRGQTALARDLVDEVVRRWPGDQVASDEATYLHLLLAPTRAETERLERRSAERLANDPANWQVRTNLALARLQFGQAADALAALFDGTATPAAASALAAAPIRAQIIHAAALAADGQRRAASEEASRLIALPMLPEERALIADVAENRG